MKIAVYAIAKDEEKFVDRWYETAKEADYVCVLDTGSADKTVDKLKSYNCIVKTKIIQPWRFDVARNESLKIIPEDADVLVCLDLDEIIQPGWAEIIRRNFHGTRGRYLYVWSHESYGRDGVSFNADKIHTKSYYWKNPVHEVLKSYGEESYCDLPLRVDHWPDEKKSRSNYLPLLELAVKEEPENDRNMHYLGREYMFHREYSKAIETLEKHLALRSAVWPPERAASMRFIARCKIIQGKQLEAEAWLQRAIIEAPEYREAWFEMMKIMYYAKNWKSCIYYGESCVNIRERPLSYICEPDPWGPLPFDMLSIAYYNTGRPREALEAANHALMYGPDDRIMQNVKIMQSYIGEPS